MSILNHYDADTEREEINEINDRAGPVIRTCANCNRETETCAVRGAGDFCACQHCGHDCVTQEPFSNWLCQQNNHSFVKQGDDCPHCGWQDFSAPAFLQAGIKHMQQRAIAYDKPEGERSMGKTVAAFNAITGLSLTEEQGWLLQGILKMVRSQQGCFKADNYEDEASYAALRGECAARDRRGLPS